VQTNPNQSTDTQSPGAPADTPRGVPLVRIFTMSLDGAVVPLALTRKALQDFELQGLEAMDECLFLLSERITPANTPHIYPNPLDLVGQMMVDGANSGDTRKVMLCALWLGHHYPSLSGLVSTGPTHTFVRRVTSRATSYGHDHNKIINEA